MMRVVHRAAVVAGVLLSALLFALLPSMKIQAAGVSLMDELDFTEIQDSVDEILGQDFQFRDVVTELTEGGEPLNLESFLKMILTQTGENWRTEKRMLLSILVLGIAAAMMANFSGIFRNQQIAEVSFEITYLLLFLLLLQIFTDAEELTATVLSGLQDFMSALIPAYCLSVTLASAGTTALVFYQFLLTLIYLIEWLVQHGLMSLIHVCVILVFINHLTKEEYLSQMSDLIQKSADRVLKAMLALVVGFNAVQGMISPAIDSLKTTLVGRAASALPGVGNVAGTVTDVILGSAALIKNGIGVAALLVILLLCLVPLTRLGVLVLILEGAAALIQPVSDKRIVGCVAGVGACVRLLFRVVVTTAVLFMLTIGVVAVSTGRL
jgi:stage III sporulation protein AE